MKEGEALADLEKSKSQLESLIGKKLNCMHSRMALIMHVDLETSI